MFDPSLLNLPWVTLVTLACGYIGYFIANVGLKDHHQPVDITFATLIFGLFSAMVYHSLTWAGLDAWTATLPTVAYAFASGAFWRRYARKWMYKFLRDNDISWSDGTSSAWQQMFDLRDNPVYEISVHLKNGMVLLSRDIARFENFPNGPCTLGTRGDVILYVTHYIPEGSQEWVEEQDVVNETYGNLATWVPAEQIALLEIRRTGAKYPRK